jgi:hypothetical protein
VQVFCQAAVAIGCQMQVTLVCILLNTRHVALFAWRVKFLDTLRHNCKYMHISVSKFFTWLVSDNVKIISGLSLFALLWASCGFGMALRFGKWHVPGILRIDGTRYLSVMPDSAKAEQTMQQTLRDYKQDAQLETLITRIVALEADNKKMYDDIAAEEDKQRALHEQVDVDETKYGTLLALLGSLFGLLLAPLLVSYMGNKLLKNGEKPTEG